MRNNVKNIMSTILVFVLVVGCFAALPLTTNAAPTPVSGNPGWKIDYSKSTAPVGHPEGKLWDRGNAAGDKITSNAHSADWEGVYFYWDDKQKEDGVLLVCDWVFDLFADSYTHAKSGISFGKSDPGFVLTAKNSNNYWGYKIARSTGKVIDTVDGVNIWAFAIPKQFQYLDNKGKAVTESLKNINMVFIDGTYKSAWIVLAKAWFDEEGCLVWKPFENIALNKEIAFSNGLKLGINEDDFCEIKITDFVTAANGKTITITETKLPSGYAFKDAHILYGEGKKITGGVSLVVKPGDKAAVLFENQKQWAWIEIVKVWNDFEGKILDDTSLDATFTIEGTEYVDVVPGTYRVKEGTYIVSETGCTKGFNLIGDNDIPVSVEAGKTELVAFCNKDPRGPVELKIAKLVDGKIVVEWAADAELDVDEILAGLEFELYKVAAKGAEPLDARIAAVPVHATEGVLDFSSHVTAAGWYMIKENFNNEYCQKLFESPAPLYVYFDGKVVTGKVNNFDYSSETLYTIVNGYGKGGYRISTLGYPGLNNNGDIFYIGVKNTLTGTEYVSYCGNGGSRAFAGESGLDCKGYKVITDTSTYNKVEYDALLAAFNYIEDKIGDLDANRVVTQTVIWALLGNIDVTSSKFESTNLTPIEKAQVRAAVDASKNHYSGEGKIIDLVYMTCELNHDPLDCQPQIVPIYAGEDIYLIFENKVQQQYGSLKITGDVQEENIEVTYQPYFYSKIQPYYREVFERYLYSENTGTLVSKLNGGGGIVGNGNSGQAYVALDIAKLLNGETVEIEIADSSPNNRGIAYFYKVTIVDGQLIITFDNLNSASVGAIAFFNTADKPSQGQPNGKDLYSAKANLNNDNNRLTITLPETFDALYLYVHVAGGISWYSEWTLKGYEECGHVDTTVVMCDCVPTEVSRVSTYVAYDGKLTLVVTRNSDKAIVYSAVFDGESTVSGLLSGEYTCEIIDDDGNVLMADVVTVVVNELKEVALDTTIVDGELTEIYLDAVHCDDCEDVTLDAILCADCDPLYRTV